MEKRVFLIHGWGGAPNEGWRPWLAGELLKKGFEVFVPAMPDTNHPKMVDWVFYLKKIVGKVGKESFFVGHSLGCITILRYLETLSDKEKIGGAVFVAGFTDDLSYSELSNFFKTPIGFSKIKKHINKLISIHSDNDPIVSLKYGKIFKKKFNAEVIVCHNMKHFSGDEGVNKLPVALESLLKMCE